MRFLGKGELTAVLKQMGKPAAEESAFVVRQLANEVRAYIEQIVETREKELKREETAKRRKERIDVTMFGNAARLAISTRSPSCSMEVKEIFLGMGFEVATGPEVEWGLL